MAFLGILSPRFRSIFSAISLFNHFQNYFRLKIINLPVGSPLPCRSKDHVHFCILLPKEHLLLMRQNWCKRKRPSKTETEKRSKMDKFWIISSFYQLNNSPSADNDAAKGQFRSTNRHFLVYSEHNHETKLFLAFLVLRQLTASATQCHMITESCRQVAGKFKFSAYKQSLECVWKTWKMKEFLVVSPFKIKK